MKFRSPSMSQHPKHRVCITIDSQTEDYLKALQILYENATEDHRVNKSWAIRESVRSHLEAVVAEFPETEYPQYYEGLDELKAVLTTLGPQEETTSQA